jgi:hypothetical protein
MSCEEAHLQDVDSSQRRGLQESYIQGTCVLRLLADRLEQSRVISMVVLFRRTRQRIVALVTSAPARF